MDLVSLQATWIRNSLLNVLRERDQAIGEILSPNFVYENSTINSLSALLCGIILSQQVNGIDERNQKKLRLIELVDKYTPSFPALNGTTITNGNHVSSGDIILITGSTGSFGSNILAKLIASPQVTHIYALSRASAEGVEERHRSAFSREGLDVELLESDKIRFVEGDASETSFGVDNALFTEVSRLASILTGFPSHNCSICVDAKFCVTCDSQW